MILKLNTGKEYKIYNYSTTVQENQFDKRINYSFSANIEMNDDITVDSVKENLTLEGAIDNIQVILNEKNIYSANQIYTQIFNVEQRKKDNEDIYSITIALGGCPEE